MCGIIGYVGKRPAIPVLIEGLRRLEYRGYDSAGIAYFLDGRLEIRRSAGRLAQLEAALGEDRRSDAIGIGHTRWATHGRPSEQNAHPHRVGSFTIVHNGIVENYLELKEELAGAGRTFRSDTDTEVIAHLFDAALERDGGDPVAAVREGLRRLRGSYAVCVLCERRPDLVIAARTGSPLLVGHGAGEQFVASDIPAILPYTREIIPLEDEELVVLTAEGLRLTDLQGRVRSRTAMRVDWNPVMAERGAYRHFMQKEIHEQPRALADTIAGRILPETGEAVFEGVERLAGWVEDLRRVVIVGCGTSWHAGLAGRHMIEALARIPAEAAIASEFRYSDPVLEAPTLVIAVSQSGETADTLGALREAKKRGARTLGITNGIGSTLSREADAVVLTHAGPEISVASTKAFTTQMGILFLIALWLGGRRRKIGPERGVELAAELIRLPARIEGVLRTEPAIADLARRYFNQRDFLFLGRGLQHPIALEGALKLKEISYLHAEGYAAGEMKHGPIALVDANVPVVVLAPQGEGVERLWGTMNEVRTRDGKVIAIATEGDDRVASVADHVVSIPKVDPLVAPFLTVIPLQLLAYHIAVLRGSDVDQPRNLAKSVTVE